MNIIQLKTSQLLLRTPKLADWTLMKAFDEKNKEHFRLWESTSSCASLSYQSLLKVWRKEMNEERAFRFLIFKKDNNKTMIGQCNFTQIFRGPFQACYLGYKIDKDFEGMGLMYEALKEAINYMFEVKNLHRIMANYLPSNRRSEQLLKRLGFIVEGQAEDYLLINNKWETHILTALTNQNWKKFN